MNRAPDADEQPSLMWSPEQWAIIAARSGTLEFDWFATDRAGHLAVFSSFGTGPSPEVVRSSHTLYERLFHTLTSLPVSSDIEVIHTYRTTADWEAYARQGLFAYDNANAHTKRLEYQLIARPLRPAKASELALDSALTAIIPRLPVDFAGTPVITFSVLDS